MRRDKTERVVKTRPSWKKADQVHKIKVVMTFVAVALCISVAAGAILAWVEIKHPFDPVSSAPPASSRPVSSAREELPVYDNAFSLVVVNPAQPLQSDFTVNLKEYEGYSFEERILPALERMMEAAQTDGCALQIAGGYISAEEQNALYDQLVQELIQNQGYSKVRAEDKAQNTIGRGGYNEYQTGMLVRFSAEGETNFSASAEYRWLVKNGVEYGFILRYPDHKTSVTGMESDPSCFRYVGRENAMKMREYSMCLEEYAQYIRKQSS